MAAKLGVACSMQKMSVRLKKAKVRNTPQQSPAHSVDPYEFIESQSLLQDPLADDVREGSSVVCEKHFSKRRMPRTPRTPSSNRKTNKPRKSPLISKMERLADEEAEQIKWAIKESKKELQRQQRNSRSEKRNIFSPGFIPTLTQTGQSDQDHIAIEMGKSLSPSADVSGKSIHNGTTEAATAEEAAAVPVVVPEQDAMICRESVDENQEPLLEESPSPSLLRSRASPLLMRVGSGKVALSGTLWHEQSCDQRCTNTMTRKRPLSAGDDVSTDSGSTPTLEMSPTSTHFSPSTLNNAIGKQHSVQKLGCPLAVKSPQGKDQDVNSADNLSPSSAISMCIQTDDAIKQASLSCGSCVQPVCSASSQMSDEDCTQPLLLPKGNNPLHKQPFVPSDAPTCATEKEGARSLLQQKTDKAIGPSRSQRIIQLLDLYARDLRQAQSSVIQRVPWGQPISAGANSLKVGQSNYLVWAEKSRMPAIKEQQLAISYSSSQKGLSKTCPKKSTEDDSWVGANRGEKKKLSLRVMVKHASPKAEPPCPLGEDFSHLAGSDLPRRGSCSRRNCVNAGNSSLQHPGLEAIADSDFTEPTESPSHNHLVGSSSVDIDARSHKLPVSAKRLKLCPARRMITDPSKKSNNSTVSSRRLGSQKYSLNSQDADVPDTLQSSSDVSNRQGFERMHTSSNVGRKKRRWITDDDSDEDCTVSNNPPSSYTQVASASMNKQEKETNDGDQEVKANHSELIDLTEDFGQVPLCQNTLSPSPSLRSCDWSPSPVLPPLARDLDNNNTESQVECPLCQECFCYSEIEAHAAECGIEGVGVAKDCSPQSRSGKVTKLPLVQRGDVSASRGKVKCSSFLSDVRRQCGERQDRPANINSDDHDVRPKRNLPLRISRGGGKKQTTPKTRKTSCGPVTTADQDDLIVIEEGAKRNHCQPDGDSKLLENISETPPTQYRTTEDGGYEVDPDAVSTSPIRGFCAIRELQAEEGREIDFHNQFPSRGSLAGRSASNRGRQHMQPNSSSCSRGKPKRLQRPRSKGRSFHKKRGRRK